MKIEFSKNELKNLIELLYFGEFMFDTSREKYPDKREKYEKLLQKIYKIAYQNGMKDFLEPSEGKIYPTREFEEDEFIWSVIDEFEDESFWQELMIMLSERDIMEKMSIDEYRNLSMAERIKLETEHEEPYQEEFAKNGIKNLKILSTDMSFLRRK